MHKYGIEFNILFEELWVNKIKNDLTDELHDYRNVTRYIFFKQNSIVLGQHKFCGLVSALACNQLDLGSNPYFL